MRAEFWLILVPKATVRAITPKTRENDFATAKNRFAMGLRSAMGIAVLRSNRVRGNAPSMEVRPALAMGLRNAMGIAVLRSKRVRGNAPSMEVRPALAMGLRLSMRESLLGNI